MHVVTLLIIVIAAIVVLGALGAFLLAPRRPRRPLAAERPGEVPGRQGARPPQETGTSGQASTATGVLQPPTAGVPPVAAPPVGVPPVAAPPVGVPPAAEAPPAPVIPAAPALEPILPLTGRMQRLRGRLSRSESAIGRGLLSLLSRDDLTEDDWEDVEATLIAADVGVAATGELVDRLKTSVAVLGARTPDQVRLLLHEHLLAAVDAGLDRTLHTARKGGPAVLLMVGVNGTGKTTTCGKLARALVGDGRTVVLGAADTFRAAAAEQLATWGERVGAPVVRGPEGGDPASVAFEAVSKGKSENADAVIIDTAGRLHTKTGLMDELGKVKRVVSRDHEPEEVLLVLDATTGQNGLVQARVFAEVVDISGIVLTKLDGTAKGGIVVAVQRELGVPVKLVGLGEGPDDLAPFEPATFVEALLGEPASA